MKDSPLSLTGATLDITQHRRIGTTDLGLSTQNYRTSLHLAEHSVLYSWVKWGDLPTPHLDCSSERLREHPTPTQKDVVKGSHVVLGFPPLADCGRKRVWLTSMEVFTDNWMDIELGAHRFRKKVSKIEPDNITKTWDT